MSELRWHPFLRQWVITATHRQDRTFHPPDDYCPLCPTRPGGFPTEVPADDYDIAVFENKFPSLVTPPHEPSEDGVWFSPVRPSAGVCEVVCYSSDHDATFASLPLRQIKKLARVWKDRYVALCQRTDVEYVFIFENKGRAMGVTLSHPHGQIYGYPFIPPVVREELAAEREHFNEHERPLMFDVLEEEIRDGRRIVWESDLFVAFVPFFARYPYEVHVTTRNHIPSLAEMDGAYLDGLAVALHAVALMYDALFGFSMPYVMVMHQEPAEPGYDFSWFHVEFYPPYRTADKLKYLAGSEVGAGVFINDTLPEESAARLREAKSSGL